MHQDSASWNIQVERQLRTHIRNSADHSVCLPHLKITPTQRIPRRHTVSSSYRLWCPLWAMVCSPGGRSAVCVFSTQPRGQPSKLTVDHTYQIRTRALRDGFSLQTSLYTDLVWCKMDELSCKLASIQGFKRHIGSTVFNVSSYMRYSTDWGLTTRNGDNQQLQSCSVVRVAVIMVRTFENWCVQDI